MTEHRPDDYTDPTQYSIGAQHSTGAEFSTPAQDPSGATPAPEPATATRSRGMGTPAKAGIGALAALALLGCGVAVADPFGWRAGGAAGDASEMVPASANAYLGVNLDPTISQQVEMARFAMKFPALRKELDISEKGDVKEQLWKAVMKQEDACSKAVDYGTDIKPWLGDQMGLAQVEGSKDPLVVIEASDETKAREAMKRLTQCSSSAPMGMAYGKGYLVLTKTQAEADKAVADASATPLSGRAEFTEDFGKVGTRGVLSFWGTRAGLEAMQQQGEGSSSMPSAMPSMAAMGGNDLRSMAGTLRFAAGNPEMRVVSKSTKTLPTSTTHTAVDQLPADTAVAFGVSDGATIVDQVWPLVEEALKSSGTSLADVEKQAGVKLPEDLKTLLGKDFRIAVGKVPAQISSPNQVPAAVLTSTDQTKLQELVDRTRLTEQGISVTPGAGDVQILGVNPTWVSRLASAPTSTLGSSEMFKAAYPTADQAQGGLFVHLDSFKELLGKDLTAAQKENLEPLQAIGLSTHNEDANYSVGVARVTAK